MIQSKTVWKMADIDSERLQHLVDELDVSPIIARMLLNRGLVNATEARRFLTMDAQTFHDPFLFTDMNKLVERVHLAIERGEQVTVFGDYDADGVTSTVILLKALAKVGVKKLDYYIPDRFEEGYGLNRSAVESLAQKGTTLLITCDTGITAVEEVKYAGELGIDCLITDHHQLDVDLPVACAIVHPNHPEGDYPYPNLAGAGVAFKVSQALLSGTDDELLALATIGTIADQVELLDENRLLVYRGLQCLRETKSLGLLALARVSGAELGSVNEETIGFTFVPRINAAGRLNQAGLAVDLLLTNFESEAEEKAKELDGLNRERQLLVEKIMEEVAVTVQADEPIIVVSQDTWHRGVLGIVSSRLVGLYNRPAIVLGIDRETGLAHGSGRSVENFDLYQQIADCRDLLENFGGHPMAAGLTISSQNIERFRQTLLERASNLLTEKVPIQITRVEAEVAVSELTIPFIKQLNRFAPFGNGNPKMNFLLTPVRFSFARRIGNEQSHLKATIEQDGFTIDMIGFGAGIYFERLTTYDMLALVGQPSLNEWRGNVTPQIILTDLSCERTQVIDCRSKPLTEQVLAEIPEPRQWILFSEKRRKQFPEAIQREAILFSEGIELSYENNLVFLDVPQDRSAFEKAFCGRPFSAFFLFLKKESDDLFLYLPSRSEFKAYYAFLTKNPNFAYLKFADDFERKKHWASGTLAFMSEVFFELGFATIENGIVSLNDSPPKRDLQESKRYQQMQAQLELENLLLLSSSKELYQYFTVL